MTFVDPRPGLKAEYEMALSRLTEELGEAPTRRERLRFRRERFRLHRKYFGVTRCAAYGSAQVSSSDRSEEDDITRWFADRGYGLLVESDEGVRSSGLRRARLRYEEEPTARTS